MEIDERKKELKTALINAFLDEKKTYKKTIRLINKDFKKANIDYKYTYDEFCGDFLKQSLESVETIDIFAELQLDKFLINLWEFNLYNLNEMINKKLIAIHKNEN